MHSIILATFAVSMDKKCSMHKDGCYYSVSTGVGVSVPQQGGASFGCVLLRRRRAARRKPASAPEGLRRPEEEGREEEEEARTEPRPPAVHQHLSQHPVPQQQVRALTGPPTVHRVLIRLHQPRADQLPSKTCRPYTVRLKRLRLQSSSTVAAIVA